MDGTLIVSGSRDKTARVWDAAGKALYTLEGHSDHVVSVAFNHVMTRQCVVLLLQ